MWRTFAVFWAAFVVLIVFDIVRRGFPSSSWLGLAWVAFLSSLVWCSSWRPLVTYDFDRVEIRNPLRTSRIPWNTVTRIDAKDTLRVHTDGHIVRAWAVARSGAMTNLVRSARRPSGIGATGPEQAALHELARRSPIDYAVEVLRDIWQLRGKDAKGELEIRWAIPEIAAILISAAAVVIATVAS